MSILQKPPTAKGMAFITLEDEFGTISLVLKPKVYLQFRTLIMEEPLLWAEGVIEKNESITNIIVKKMGVLPTQKMLRLHEDKKILPYNNSQTAHHVR